MDPNDDSAEHPGPNIYSRENTTNSANTQTANKCTTGSANYEHVECTKLQRNELGGARAPKNELEDELIWIIMNRHDISWIFMNKIGI